jgi:hypothetical protein
MAKSIEYEDLVAEGSAPKDLKEELEKDEAFLRSLDRKQAVALHLSKELAAWFGDHSAPPVRL